MNWKAVVGYERMYEVSDTGEVRSIDRRIVCKTRGKDTTHIRKYQGKDLKPGISSNGYPTVSLGKFNSICVHILVAEAFICPRPEGYEPDHLDRIRHNNHVDNLKWIPRAENRAQRWV